MIGPEKGLGYATAILHTCITNVSCKQSCHINGLNFGHGRIHPDPGAVEILMLWYLSWVTKHRGSRWPCLWDPVLWGSPEMILVSPSVESLILPHLWQEFGVALPPLKQLLARRGYAVVKLYQLSLVWSFWGRREWDGRAQWPWP